jgi:hypothetical protein
MPEEESLEGMEGDMPEEEPLEGMEGDMPDEETLNEEGLPEEELFDRPCPFSTTLRLVVELTASAGRLDSERGGCP